MTETVAEIGSNFLGDISLGKRLIKECKDAGASAVKMQFFKSDVIYPKDNPLWQKFPNLKDFELTYEKAKELKEYADEIGIDWFASCFFLEAVDWCEKLGVKRYKVSHRREFRDFEIMGKIVETKKPIVVSIIKEEVFGLSDTYADKRVTVLYCVPLYPTPREEVNLDIMTALRDKYDIKVGYSNHVIGKDGVEICREAIRKKADIVEIHTMLDESYRDKSPDGCCSLTIEELKEIVP